IEESLFSGRTRLAHRLGDLLLASLHADHRASRPARHRARELAEARSDVEHALACLEAELGDGRLVHHVVERREPFLFFGLGPVDVEAPFSHRGSSLVPYSHSMPTLREPSSFADLAVIRLLFEEYRTWLGIDLGFQ